MQHQVDAAGTAPLDLSALSNHLQKLAGLVQSGPLEVANGVHAGFSVTRHARWLAQQRKMPRDRESLRRAGAKGGRSDSGRKGDAAAINGRKGGRPRGSRREWQEEISARIGSWFLDPAADAHIPLNSKRAIVASLPTLPRSLQVKVYNTINGTDWSTLGLDENWKPWLSRRFLKDKKPGSFCESNPGITLLARKVRKGSRKNRDANVRNVLLLFDARVVGGDVTSGPVEPPTMMRPQMPAELTPPPAHAFQAPVMPTHPPVTKPPGARVNIAEGIRFEEP